jgi:hypothetical protein
MHLSPDDVDALLRTDHPRHVHDATILELQASAVPDDRVVLVLDEVVWTVDLDLGRSAHSMTIALARRLHHQLGELLAAVDR